MTDSNPTPLQRIKLFLHNSHPMMLLIGEKDWNKTQILNSAVSMMRAKRHIIRLRGSANIRPMDLANILAKHWKVKVPKKNVSLENQLTTILAALAKADQYSILVIEDAHLLSFSVLAAISHLSNLQENQSVYLHLLLSGRSILSEKMNNLQSKEIPQITLGCLNEEQTKQKVQEYLQQAKVNLSQSVRDTLTRKIFEKSKGLPEAVHQMAQKLIDKNNLTNSTKQQAINTKTLNWQRYTVKLTAIAGLLLTGFVLWHLQHKAPHAQLNHPPILANTTPIPNIKPAHTASASIYCNLNTTCKMPLIHTTQTKQPSAKKIIVASAMTAKPSHIMPPQQNKTPQLDRYTIQLMSGPKTKPLLSLIHKEKLNSDIEVMRTQYDHQLWYVAITGHYANHQQAQKALKSLSPSLKKLHPWIRPTDRLKKTGS